MTKRANGDTVPLPALLFFLSMVAYTGSQAWKSHEIGKINHEITAMRISARATQDSLDATKVAIGEKLVHRASQVRSISATEEAAQEATQTRAQQIVDCEALEEIMSLADRLNRHPQNTQEGRRTAVAAGAEAQREFALQCKPTSTPSPEGRD